ncbi:probable receptor-like protein kinase At5g20050, partial [Phalaenopsis equestris]|uniref:probable receptor-like protein kinase At5g20050 n=1 Tax=Phalaenopsis equestris TaxID=78828 RepID=UPI0009E554DE
LNAGGSHRLLVYEFAHHGSLDKWIFKSSSDVELQQQSLPWRIRVRVAIEVAKALAYLHHDCRSKVLHLDVKPENVLLDEEFHALVADFGLSKMMGRDESRVITSLRGTKGYLAPEWLMETGVSDKSDVYSYGMMLLEMVGGRRNCLLLEEEGGDQGGRRRRIWSYFPAIVAEKMKQRRVMEVVDGRMGIGEGEEEEVQRLVNVAFWCIQEERKMRPSMVGVVDMLEGRMGVVETPPEMSMLMADYLDVDEIEAPVPALLQIQTPEGLTHSFAMTMLS